MAPQPATPSWRVEPYEAGIRLLGRLRTREAAALIGAIRRATAHTEAVAVDLAGADEVDGGVIALIRADFAKRGIRIVELRGDDRFGPLLELYDGAPPSLARPQKRGPEPLFPQIGRLTVQEVGSFREYLVFAGSMTVALVRLVRRPSRVNWSEIPRLIEEAGMDAVPIVVIINLLVGFVLAYMSARELTAFGANILVADLVGIAAARQLAPLMTTIVVIGRSSAAYATELGSMKTADEIDALRTLGLEPICWLVVPRILALLVALPLLTLIADLVATLGGLIAAMTSLGVTPQAYLHELQHSLTLNDVESGMIMTVAFALATGFIACRQGFAASGGPQGVGRRTTSTVVRSLLAIVTLDAGFTVLFRVFGKP